MYHMISPLLLPFYLTNQQRSKGGVHKYILKNKSSISPKPGFIKYRFFSKFKTTKDGLGIHDDAVLRESTDPTFSLKPFCWTHVSTSKGKAVRICSHVTLYIQRLRLLCCHSLNACFLKLLQIYCLETFGLTILNKYTTDRLEAFVKWLKLFKVGFKPVYTLNFTVYSITTVHTKSDEEFINSTHIFSIFCALLKIPDLSVSN